MNLETTPWQGCLTKVHFEWYKAIPSTYTFCFFNQTLRSQFPDRDTGQAPPSCQACHMIQLKPRTHRSSSLWGEHHFLRTQLTLFAALGPFHLFPMGRKKLFCEKLYEVKQEAAKRLDLKGMKPLWAAGCNSRGSCLQLQSPRDKDSPPV